MENKRVQNFEINLPMRTINRNVTFRRTTDGFIVPISDKPETRLAHVIQSTIIDVRIIRTGKGV